MGIDILLINLIVVTLVVIILGFPISFCLGAGAVFYLIANDFPLSQAVSKLAFSVQSYTMLAIPLFMLTGRLMNESKITDRIFDFANMLVGRIPGGLGHVNVVLSLMFSGMSGSAFFL
jgi:TRAP-type mannitol/chloroaromatic compound transport system permease large subunit